MDHVATAIWGSPTFPRVLAILLEEPRREFRFAELVEGVGADRETVHRALQRGMAAGLVSRRQIGNQFLYQANLGSPLLPEMRTLAAKLYGAQRLVADVLASAGPPDIELAFIYGSFAAGAARPDSDIDLFVIGIITRTKLAQLLKEVQERIGRSINGLAYRRSEVERRLRAGDAFFLEVWAGPKTMLVGSEDELPQLTEGQVSWA